MLLPLLPSPVLEVMTTPEVLTLAGAVVVALLTSALAFLRFIPKWLDHRLAALEVHATRAADASEKAAHQTANSHATNLRDDLDEKFRSVFDRMDAMENSRRLDSDRDREERERFEQEAVARAQRAEKQIDGLRDDLRAMDLRYQKENGHLWDAIGS